MLDEAKAIHEKWRDAYREMVLSGVSEIEAADAMVAVGALMVEQNCGTEAARIALVAGFNLLCQQERPTTPPPSSDDALH
jgi:hypothetical protein